MKKYIKLFEEFSSKGKLYGTETLQPNGQYITDIEIKNCNTPISFPEGVQIAGNIEIEGCDQPITFGKNVKIFGDVYIAGCQGELIIDGSVVIDGDFSSFESPNFPPDKFKVTGEEIFDGESDDEYGSGELNPYAAYSSGSNNEKYIKKINALKPGDNLVEGVVDIYNYDGDIRIPDGVNLKGDFRFLGINGNVTFGNNVTIDGELEITKCSKTVTFGQNFNVKYDLYMSRCPNVVGMENINVGGDLYSM